MPDRRSRREVNCIARIATVADCEVFTTAAATTAGVKKVNTSGSSSADSVNCTISCNRFPFNLRHHCSDDGTGTAAVPALPGDVAH